MSKSWKKSGVSAILAASLATGIIGCSQEETLKQEGADAKQGVATGTTEQNVSVIDYTFDTAGNMLAYAEFELSGEPMVEGLGLDLDVLDVTKLDQPTKFDYTAGVESYEYSEEAMYEVVEKSGLGLHLVKGPTINKLAKESGKSANEVLANRFIQLAESVGYPQEEIFQNMYPTFIEYQSADPHYIQPVDTSKFTDGENGAYIPKYQLDYASLRWDRNKMDKILTPSAYGATFLKQALWAGDFLGGMHTVDTDEELEAQNATDDKDPNIVLGVSSADGMQGMILTEEIWNKLNFIRNHLFYNPTSGKLEAAKGSGYDPSEGLSYLPHAIKVTEDGEADFIGAKTLEVTDARSLLQDQWLMLWPAAEFYGTTDQRSANPNTNPAFRAVFDGAPFPDAPAQNLDQEAGNDIASDDPFTVNRDVLLQVFRNLEAMHWNAKEGIFVSEHDGKEQGDYLDTFQAGYTMEALRMFQRAIDGLPVGYANGDDAKGLSTKEGQLAIEMIRKQADFMMENMIGTDGLIANGWTVGKGKEASTPEFKAQLGAIRGLTAAFLATKDEKYRDAARTIYTAVDEKLWDPAMKAYKTKGNDTFQYDAFTAGAVSGVFRSAINSLRNVNGDQNKPEALDRKTIISRYVDFYDQVIDGPSLDQGMQASEFWDTGDVYIEGDQTGNTDQDNVPQIQAGHGEYGIAPVLVPVEVKK
ncbi:hypothetical protein J2Z37_003821 [Ammoniphilus resinae]|uniref:Uncharacterized protein n=1 Tax=Ammoniphilus resinae TaxID=861532 RepID=A0ABS4GU64_9BACL|nr:hypothetical protein [Ammoniphilus resinae]